MFVVGDLERDGEEVGDLTGWQALVRLDLADHCLGTTCEPAQLPLRKVQRLATVAQPFRKAMRGFVHLFSSLFTALRGDLADTWRL